MESEILRIQRIEVSRIWELRDHLLQPSSFTDRETGAQIIGIYRSSDSPTSEK